jgi:heat shock protein HslJ
MIRLALGGFVLCAAAVMLSSCGGSSSAPSAPQGQTELAGTQWVLDVSALKISGAESVHSWLAFAHNQVSGNDGCNSFSGSYTATGSKLKFGALAGTLMACTGPADAVAREVTASLPRVRAYEIKGKTLHLEDAGGTTLLSYAASTPGVEGDWTVMSVLYDDAIRSVIANTELTAKFSNDGTISGSTGCNDFHGDYTLEGKKLHIGPLAATKKACPTTEATKQEAGYLAALESATRIDQVGPQLTLLNAKGQMAVTLTRR